MFFEIRYYMVKSYKTHSFINGLRFSCVSALKENKGKLILSFILVFTAICTGVFIAIKSNNAYELGRLQDISLDDFYSGIAASSSAFFSRSLSLVVNVTILTVLSFSIYLFPLAEVLFIYRGYLFGLNFALVFIFYGLSGAITGIIVILPCQLCTLFVLIMFYFIFQKMNRNSKKFGCTECNRALYVLFAILLLIAINLIETLLLCVLNGKVIMVI